MLRNYLLKHGIEEKREMMEIRGIIRKELLDDLKEKSRDCKLKQEALDRTVW